MNNDQLSKIRGRVDAAAAHSHVSTAEALTAVDDRADLLAEVDRLRGQTVSITLQLDEIIKQVRRG